MVDTAAWILSVFRKQIFVLCCVNLLAGKTNSRIFTKTIQGSHLSPNQISPGPVLLDVIGDPQIHHKIKMKITSSTSVHHFDLHKTPPILSEMVKVINIGRSSAVKDSLRFENIEPDIKELDGQFFSNQDLGTVVSVRRHPGGHFLVEGHLFHDHVIAPPGSHARHKRASNNRTGSHIVYMADDTEHTESVKNDDELIKMLNSINYKHNAVHDSNDADVDFEEIKRLTNTLRDLDSDGDDIENETEMESDDDDYVRVPDIFDNEEKWKEHQAQAEAGKNSIEEKLDLRDPETPERTFKAKEEGRQLKEIARRRRQAYPPWAPKSSDTAINPDHRRHAHFTVEVLAMVDARTYKEFNYDWKATQIFLLHFWQSVNARFKAIVDPIIQLKLTTITKILFPAFQPFIEKNRVSPESNLVDVTGLLTDFQAYVNEKLEQNTILANHDVAILMTGEDLSKRTTSGSWSKKSRGIAYVRGACISAQRFSNQTYDVGVAEVGRSFRGVLATTHELGHLLGAFHDGDKNASGCPLTSGYVMSSHWSDPYRYNRFSQCSRNNMKDFMENAWYSDCLMTSDTKESMTYAFPAQLPGQVFSLDDQCKTYVEGVPCKNVSLESQCAQLCCEKWSHPFTSREPAADGTHCAPDKVCYNGECLPLALVGA